MFCKEIQIRIVRPIEKSVLVNMAPYTMLKSMPTENLKKMGDKLIKNEGLVELMGEQGVQSRLKNPGNSGNQRISSNLLMPPIIKTLNF